MPKAPSPLAQLIRALRSFRDVIGWQRMVNWLIPPNTSGEFTVRNDGLIFAGNIDSFIDRQVYLFGNYEEKAIRLFLSSIIPGRRGTVLDIGANVGTHSLAFARHFRNVLSFEPNPTLWSAFERNISLNGAGNITLNKVGLGETEGRFILYGIDKMNHGLGTFSTIEQYDLPLRPVANCDMVIGDPYLKTHGVDCVDAVKIDVQGFEPEVLRGLRDLLQRNKPVVWFELATATSKKIITREHLRELVPYPVTIFRLTQIRRIFTRDLILKEVSSDPLQPGDYILVPK
jgi:FkbM family methyltransferase